jgi:type VI secretion system protein
VTACALALAFVLTGCPKKPKVLTKHIPGMAKETKLGVHVHISQQANGGNPVALDILLVSDKELLKELQKMPARDWFARRGQIILDYPKERLVVRQWEWVPGQLITPDRLTVSPEIKGGIIFANYFNPGEHRAVIDPRAKEITIELGNDKLQIVTNKK